MAQLKKSRARTPLAEGQSSFSWIGGFSGLPEDGSYSFIVNSDTHSYQFSMQHEEVNSFLNFYAGHETLAKGGVSWGVDKRTLPERLRALADKLEAQGELKRMELTG